MNIIFTHAETLNKEKVANVVKETDYLQLIKLAEGISPLNFEQQMINLLGYIKPRHDVIVSVPSIDSDIKAAVKSSLKHFSLKVNYCFGVNDLLDGYRKVAGN